MLQLVCWLHLCIITKKERKRDTQKKNQRLEINNNGVVIRSGCCASHLLLLLSLTLFLSSTSTQLLLLSSRSFFNIHSRLWDENGRVERRGEERREKKVEEPPDTNTKNRFCSVFSRLGFFFWSRRGCKTPKSWNRLVGWQVEKEEKRGRKELTWSVGRVESDATCSWRTSPCRRARCRLWWRNGRSWPAAGWSPRCCRCKTTST